MLNDRFKEALTERLETARGQGTYKTERLLTSPQGTRVSVQESDAVINLCANNYLGLSNDPRLIEAAKKTLDSHGFGMSSVRFICGTQELHRKLERRIAAFLGKDDAILYSSCFDANGGLFEVILGDEDAIISDQLNHASIIDGIRLCKAKRFRYAHTDMADLEETLIHARGRRLKAIITDGVFSMDGEVAPLPDICDLAERYSALVIVDDSHSTGFFGPGGRGTAAFHEVEERVDIITSTFGKALGGASGGFTAGPQEVIDSLRQFSRPYLFSNSLAPAIVGATLTVLDLLEGSAELRERLNANQRRFRQELTAMGFNIASGDHPIVPIMFYNARLAEEMANDLLAEGVYVIAFSYPVVPHGEARIRVQLSAAHTEEQLDRAIAAFEKIGRRHGILGLGREEILKRFSA
jgi:glycine C-acetyltransferase